MRIDKRSYTQIEKALSGIDLPITVYTASGEQVYPAPPAEVREEEIPALRWEDGYARLGSMKLYKLNVRGMVVGVPDYVPVGEQILQMAGAMLTMLLRAIDRDMDRDEVLRKVLENELLTQDKPDKSRIAAIRSIWKGGADK